LALPRKPRLPHQPAWRCRPGGKSMPVWPAAFCPCACPTRGKARTRQPEDRGWISRVARSAEWLPVAVGTVTKRWRSCRGLPGRSRLG